MTSALPRISLVIPAFNEERELPELLESIAVGQRCYRDGPEAIEIIVADNGSTDRTAELALANGCKVACIDRRSIAAARNGGAQVARAPVLAFVDADAVRAVFADIGDTIACVIVEPIAGNMNMVPPQDGFLETLRELAALDGAFIVNPKGIVEFAGVYLDAPAASDLKISKGLGSRHVAAAALTAKTDSVAVVISESSGTITVFCKGQDVMKLEGSGGIRK